MEIVCKHCSKPFEGRKDALTVRMRAERLTSEIRAFINLIYRRSLKLSS
jgi:hypothetical protein